MAKVTLRAQIGEYNLSICRLHGCNECRHEVSNNKPCDVVYIGWRADTIVHGYYYWFHLECFSKMNGTNYYKMGSQIEGLTKYYEARDVYGFDHLTQAQQSRVKHALQMFYTQMTKLKLPKRINLMNMAEMRSECKKRCLSTMDSPKQRLIAFLQNDVFLKQEKKGNDLLVFGYIKQLLKQQQYSYLLFPVYLIAIVVKYCPVGIFLN